MRKMIMLAVVAALVLLPGAGVAEAADPVAPPGVAAIHAARRALLRSASLPGAGTGPVTVTGSSVAGGHLVATGGRHTCAIVAFAGVWCWGANDDGQLGDGSTAASRRPVFTSADSGLGDTDGVLQIVAGDAHTCAAAVELAGQALGVYCWGDNSEGQLGDGGFTSRTRPEQVATDVDEVVAGAQHTCVLSDDGTVSCWGRNDVGQLGIGVVGGSRSVPHEVPGLTGIVHIAADDNDTCAVDDQHRAWCWGSDTHGQLGDGGGASGTPSASPVAVVAVPAGFAAIDVGRRHVCAVTPGGAAYCWGDDSAGQLGSAPADGSTPSPVHGGLRFAAISAGGDSSCGATTAGRVYCWGADTFGQLGTGGHTGHATPAPADERRLTLSPLVRLVTGWTGPRVVDAEVGENHGCVVDGEGVVYCTGRNASGQLGLGTTTDADILARTALAPGPARRVRVQAGDGALRVRWTAAKPGASAVSAYVAFAFTGSLDIGSECVALTGAGCVIGALANDRRYTVVIAAASHGGVSYSAFAHGTPQAAGSGAGLPITGPGLTAAWLLLGGGVALLLVARGRAAGVRR